MPRSGFKPRRLNGHEVHRRKPSPGTLARLSTNATGPMLRELAFARAIVGPTMLYACFVLRPALLRGTLRTHLRLRGTLRTHLRLRWALRMDLRLGWTLRMHFRWCANGRLRTGRRLELGSARIHGSIPTLDALVVIDAR